MSIELPTGSIEFHAQPVHYVNEQIYIHWNFAIQRDIKGKIIPEYVAVLEFTNNSVDWITIAKDIKDGNYAFIPDDSHIGEQCRIRVRFSNDTFIISNQFTIRSRSPYVVYIDHNPIVVITPPSVVGILEDESVVEGDTVSFTITATGSSPIIGQWQVNDGIDWDDIPGALDDTYSFIAQLENNNYQYRRVFTNPGGTTFSNAASLTVTSAPIPPSVVGTLEDQTVVEGDTVSFTITATGTSPIIGQWQVNDGNGWDDIEGELSNTYSFVAQLVNDSYQYRRVFTNAAGTASSNVASLTVTPAPVLAIIGEAAFTNENPTVGDSVTLAVTIDSVHGQLLVDNDTPVSGEAITFSWEETLTFEYRKDDVLIPGETADTLTLDSLTTADSGSYTVTVRDTRLNISREFGPFVLTVNEIVRPSKVYLDETSNTNDSTTYTFTQDLGAPAADRMIVLVLFSRSTTGQLLNTLTIDGQAQTKTVSALTSAGTSTGNSINMYAFAWPTGSTAEIVATYNTAQLRCVLRAYAVYGVDPATVIDTDSYKAVDTENPLPLGIDNSAGGLIIAAGVRGASDLLPVTFTGITQDGQAALTESLIPVTGSDFYENVATDRALSIDLSAGVATTANMAIAASFGLVVPVDPLLFTRDNVITRGLSAGRTSTATLKVPGVDPLPTGASLLGNRIVVSGDDVVFEDWAISRITGTGAGCIIRQCTIEDLGLGGADYPVDQDGDGWTIENCDLFGSGGPKSSSAFIVTSSNDFTVRACHLYLYARDGIKTTGDGILFEYNYFDNPQNQIGVLAYDAGTNYPIGAIVNYLGNTYEKLTTAPAGTTPVDGSDWSDLDPHSDQLSQSGGSGIIRYNYFGPITVPFDGPNRRVWMTRNTGTATPFGDWLIYGNVMEPWSGAYPLGAGVIREFESSRTYSVGNIARLGVVNYRAINETTTDPASDLTDWVPDRDINISGNFLWAHNWVEAGNSGVAASGDSAPEVYANNSNEAGDPILNRKAQTSIAAPATIESDLSYPTTVLYGPAQKFLVTPTEFTGTVTVDDVVYTNVCAIRAGTTDIAGWIDNNGFWYVAPLMGITITDNEDGSYTVRVYDPDGNPMNASLTIPVGVATVVAQADEVTTGPAWGVAPAVLQTNNIPNAYQHTTIETVGQLIESVGDLDSPVTFDFSNLPLLENDYVIAFRGAASNTQRSLNITTADYSPLLSSLFSNGTQDPNGCIGAKVMGPVPDGSVTFSSSTIGGNASLMGVRAYRNVASVTMLEAESSGATIQPPTVTITNDNSVVLVYVLVAHNLTDSQSFDTSGYVNTSSFESYANTYVSGFLAEVEVDTGSYTPPALTFSGGSFRWIAVTVVLTPEEIVIPTVSYTVVDETNTGNLTDIPNLRVSLDGGSTWTTLSAAGLTLTQTNGDEFTVTGFADSTVRDAALFHFEQKIPGEINNGQNVLDGLFVKIIGGPVPALAAIPGYPVAATPFDDPLEVTQ